MAMHFSEGQLLNQDYLDILRELSAAGAEFLIVGAYAVALHAQPRFTEDLDVWVNPCAENTPRIWAALEAFGAPLGELTVEDLQTPGTIFQIGVKPRRIDIITRIDGVEFAPAWTNRVEIRIGGERFPVLGRAHLIANKRASGRPKDIVDLDWLQSVGPLPSKKDDGQ